MPFIAPIIGSLGFIGQIAIGVGLNLISNALAKKKRRKASQENSLGGTHLNIAYGGAQPREIGVGLFATAGQEIFACAFGGANKTFARVVQLSDFCIHSVARILIGKGEVESSILSRGTIKIIENQSIVFIVMII